MSVKFSGLVTPFSFVIILLFIVFFTGSNIVSAKATSKAVKHTLHDLKAAPSGVSIKQNLRRGTVSVTHEERILDQDLNLTPAFNDITNKIIRVIRSWKSNHSAQRGTRSDPSELLIKAWDTLLEQVTNNGILNALKALYRDGENAVTEKKIVMDELLKSVVFHELYAAKITPMQLRNEYVEHDDMVAKIDRAYLVYYTERFNADIQYLRSNHASSKHQLE